MPALKLYNSKDQIQLLDQLPDLLEEARKLNSENPYEILGRLKAGAHKSRQSYKIGIPLRHFVSCSSGQHTFPEIKYEGVIFSASGETVFTILESEMHEFRVHSKHP